MFAGFLGAILGGAIVLMIGRSRRDGFNPMRIILAGAAYVNSAKSRYCISF